MKVNDLLSKHPITFVVWNVNEDTGVFWSDVSTLEENGFLDPWGNRISIDLAKKIRNRWDDVIEYQLESEINGHSVDLVIMNE